MRLPHFAFLALLLSTLIVVSACTTHQKLLIIDMQENLSCIQTFDIVRNQQYIINANSTYQQLIKHRAFSILCKDFELPPIDFSQYTLLGKSAEGRGCDATFGRSVVQNGSLVTYTIDVVTTGNCTNKIWTSTNWILVPKLKDKTVKFDVVQKHLDG